MIDLTSLIEKTRQEIYAQHGEISRNDLYNKFGQACAELGLSKHDFIEKTVNPIYDEYTNNLQGLIKQTKEYLIRTNGGKSREEIFDHFINDCNYLNLTEELFYKRILKQSSKLVELELLSIEEKEHKHLTTNKLNQELNIQENKVDNNSIFFKRLIKIIFDDGIVESEELQKIFSKAKEFKIDIDTLVHDIDQRLDKGNYKSYPKASLETGSLKETLLSANWYSEPIYSVLINPPPPPGRSNRVW